MNKKIKPILAASAILAGGLAFTSNPVSASVMFDEREYWTIDEMMEINTAAVTEIKETCGSDKDCQVATYDLLRFSSEAHRAWDNYVSDIFAITAVNPTTKTMRIIHHDIDTAEWSRKTSTNWYRDFTELYIAWFEPGQKGVFTTPFTNIGSRTYLWFTADFKNGIENPGVHFLYTSDDTKEGKGWFPVANQEIEISIPDIDKNTSNIIYASIYEDNSMLNDTVDYSACLASSKYSPGMECQVVYNSDGRAAYTPAWPKGTVLEENSGKGSAIANLESDTPETATNLKAPNTGIVAGKRSENNSPWWVIAVITSSLSLILCWFLPKNLKNHKKIKKSQKKVKKALDIDKNLR